VIAPERNGSPDQGIALAQDLLADADRVAVLTGAGISTDSGIPDFRGPQGLWTRNPKAERLASLDHYLNDPEVRQLAWRTRLDSAAWEARPNAGHLALLALQQRGQLHGLITQNVDGLHQRAGIDPARVVEVHGTMHRSMCWTCGDRRDMADTLQRVVAGEVDPDCLVCRVEGRHGILKSDTISFGQALEPAVIERAFEIVRTSDVLLAVGSTLQVYPVAGVVPEAARHGSRIIILNAEPTQMDHYATVVLRGGISQVLPAILLPDS
jgi:NAD-dependent deacetylase